MLLFTLATACSDVKDDHDHHDHDHELITTLVLDFEATDGSESFSAEWADAEQSGTPTVDDIFLTDGLTYTVMVSVLNELEDPPEDVTEEIADEADEHQVFFTGGAVGSLVSQSYLDSDENGLPLGLENEFAVLSAGSDTLKVTLRHMPKESGQSIKEEGLADQALSDGIGSLPGDSDVSVDFSLTVE